MISKFPSLTFKQQDTVQRPSPGVFGLDILWSSDGEFKIIEVNDHPVGLDAGHQLYAPPQQNIFLSDPFLPIARILAGAAGTAPIALLLPESFMLGEKPPVMSRIKLKQQNAFADNRIEFTLSDFNHLAQAIALTGADYRFVDASALKISADELFLITGERIHSLFRRHSAFPPCEINCFCINDIRQRVLCGNKWTTYHVIAAALGNSSIIQTYSFDRSNETMAFLDRCRSTCSLVVIKPAWGSASAGLSRLTPREAQQYIFHGKFANGYICQPWVEPARVFDKGKEYYYDLRVFVVGGEVVSGFGRRAAAAVDGVAAGSPLSWLTTTGPWLPICDAAHTPKTDQDAAKINMSQQDLERLKALTVSASLVLSELAVALDFENAIQTIPNFQSLANIGTQFTPLEVIGA